MADSFDIEIDQLKGRVTQLENMDSEVVETQASPENPPLVTGAACNADRYLELTVNAFNNTIETLAKTIQDLAMTVEKPVDTLAHTVEILAMSKVQGDVEEKSQIDSEPQIEISDEESDLSVESDQLTEVAEEATAEATEEAVEEIDEEATEEAVEEVAEEIAEEIVEEVQVLPVPQKANSPRCGEYSKCKKCPHNRKKILRMFAPTKRAANGNICSKAKKCHKNVAENKN